MKKTFCLLSLFLLWGIGGLSFTFAQATVTPLSVNYNTKTVTFRVAWTNMSCNNRVWVWVDLCPVAGATPGTFQQAVISAASPTAGSIATVTNNQRGFYVTTNPSTVTATLSNATGKFSWCAYASHYPPNATSYNNGTYTLKGTPPFVITGNGTIQGGNKYVGTVINSLTDATGNPGGIARNQLRNGGACAPGLTAVGSYCRDLCADNAIASSCNSGIEVENFERSKPSTWSTNLNCPTGWRLPTLNEIRCLWDNSSPSFMRIGKHQFATSSIAYGLPGLYEDNCACCSDCNPHVVFCTYLTNWGAFVCNAGMQNWDGKGIDTLQVCNNLVMNHAHNVLCVR
jgi:hypothetical protein